MRTKQISAANMQDALATARRDLGENAVLLDTKKAARGIIVTFAIEDDDDLFFDDDLADFVPPPTPAPPRPVQPTSALHPAIAMASDALDYHSTPTVIANKIRSHLLNHRPTHPSTLEAAETALTEALTATLAFKPIPMGAKIPPTKALMLVGPHGAGKTSTIAKIAAELTLQNQPVILISTDMERLGAADNLQQLADILKCQFFVADSRPALKARLAQFEGKAWILIDSTGANIYEFKPLKELGEFASLHGVEPILTCPAGMDAREAEEMASVFNFLTIERMIITRLDAVRRLGSVFAALATGGYALANLTNSAVLSDACSPMSAPALARLMLRHVRERTTH